MGKASIVGVVYRPPDSNLRAFIDDFHQILSKINSESKLGWITGDFNINLLNYSQHCSTTDFTSYFFYPLISKPTRITSRSATLIDNIFTNSLGTAMKSGILIVSDISDHFGGFALNNFKHQQDSQPPSTIPMRRLFSNNNIELFTKSLSSCNWDFLETIDSTDQAYDEFSSHFSTIYEHFPLKKIKAKK